MASSLGEIVMKLDEEMSAVLLNLIAVLERLTAALEAQQKQAEKPRPGSGPFLEGNGE